MIEVEKFFPVSATDGFIFDDIGEGFRNPAPPRLNWDGEWKTSNEG
tara:strand:- start:1370 stop:1507 length:138 start_codon:yes stop_codon:yes gene_type:complete